MEPETSSTTDVPVPTVARDETGFYEPYANYHRSVRLWFLAYGIGAPVFLVQFPGAIDALRSAQLLRLITGLFLAGVIIQVLAALMYKTAMWYLYMKELGNLDDSTKRVRVADWLSGAYWLEFLVDATTLALFGTATWLVLTRVT